MRLRTSVIVSFLGIRKEKEWANLLHHRQGGEKVGPAELVRESNRKPDL